MEDYSTLLLSILSCLLLRSSLLARVINTDGHWMFYRAPNVPYPQYYALAVPSLHFFLAVYGIIRFGRFYELLLGLFSTIASNLKEIIVHRSY
jgi:hypothetical protein